MGVESVTQSLPLTARQQEILDFIIECVEERGYPPTSREIGEHFGFTYRGAQDHLQHLAAKGAIAIEFNAARAIRVLGVRWKMQRI